METPKDVKRLILESITNTLKVKKTFDSTIKDGKVRLIDYQVTFKFPTQIVMGSSGINNNIVEFSFRHKGSFRTAKQTCDT